MDLLLYSELQAEGLQDKAAQRAAQARKTIADLGALSVDPINALRVTASGLTDWENAGDIDTSLPPRRFITERGPNCFGQITPGFTDELFVAAELAMKWMPADGRGERIEKFLTTMDAPAWPYSFEAAWENWRRAHGYG